MSISSKIKSRRGQALLTQEQLALALKVPREHIAMWEIGSRVPTKQQVEALSKIFRVPVDFFYSPETETAVSEWSVIESELKPSDPNDKIQLWRDFLDAWAEFLTHTKAPLKGRQRCPKEIAAAGLMSDARKASTLSQEVRKHFGLGLEPIRSMYDFLNEQGVLVCKAPLGKLNNAGTEGISGMFYNHSRLGYCVLVNSQTIPARQSFTLAHEFAHALYHYSMFGLISRNGLDDPKEKFADAFAANFLVPTRKLREVVEESKSRTMNPLSVLRLAHYFGVSYKAMLFRLRNEKLISAADCQVWGTKSPKAMAPLCNIEADYFTIKDKLPELELPGIVTDQIYWLSCTGEIDKPLIQKIFGNKLSELLLRDTQTDLFSQNSDNDDEDWF